MSNQTTPARLDAAALDTIDAEFEAAWIRFNSDQGLILPYQKSVIMQIPSLLAECRALAAERDNATDAVYNWRVAAEKEAGRYNMQKTTFNQLIAERDELRIINDTLTAELDIERAKWSHAEAALIIRIEELLNRGSHTWLEVAQLLHDCRDNIVARRRQDATND